MQERFGTLDIRADHGFAITDFDTLQRGLIGQQFVEVRALHLKGGGFAVTECVTKIEGAVLLAPGEGSTVFQLEAGGLHRVQHARFFDEVDAVRKQAFANRKAREVLALDNQHIVALAFK